MDKYIFDESNGLWYERQGDYYIPCLTLPAEEEQPIGLWGQRHLRYIKEHRKARYTSLLLSGRLNSYLADIDQQAQEMLDTTIEQIARVQGITEALKATDQMAWVDYTTFIQSFNRLKGINPQIFNKISRVPVLYSGHKESG